MGHYNAPKLELDPLPHQDIPAVARPSHTGINLPGSLIVHPKTRGNVTFSLRTEKKHYVLTPTNNKPVLARTTASSSALSSAVLHLSGTPTSVPAGPVPVPMLAAEEST
jgi:hypothetical protein